MKKILTSAMCLMLVLVSSIIASPSALQRVQADAIYAAPGGDIIQSFTQYVYYDTKVEEKYLVDQNNPPAGMPAYGNYYSCAITAGSNVIGGYNKKHTNLIPGFNSTGTVFSMPVWNGAGNTTAIYDLQGILYPLMNATSAGVTIPNYLNGMNSYVSSKGYTFTSTSLMSGGVLNVVALEEAFEANKYITVFMSGFNIVSMITQTGYDKIALTEYGGAHAMSAFGYRKITYRLNNVDFRQDYYLEVCTGFSGDKALLYLGNYVTLDAAYTTHIS